MSDRQLTQAHYDLKTILAIKDIFSNRERWLRGSWAKDVDGLCVDVTSPAAYRFCFMGAYSYIVGHKITPSDEGDVKRIFKDYSSNLVSLNDNLGYDAVMQALNTAEARLATHVASPK